VPYQGDTAEKHRIKRVDRFLDNERLCVARLVRPLVRSVVGSRPRVLVAIDWTDLHDGKHQALVAGVVTGSRALPVWWRVVDKAKLTANQNRIEDQFVLPRGCEVVIMADRGFARVSFLQRLDALGLGYLIRTNSKVWVEGSAYCGLLGDLPVKAGMLRDLGVVKYQKAVGWATRVVVRFAAGQAEPWLLVTNLSEVAAKTIGDWYSRRMEVEEFFKDLKNERTGFRPSAALWRVGHYIFRLLATGRRGRPPDVFRSRPALAWDGSTAA